MVGRGRHQERNALFRENHRLFKVIRITPAGQDLIRRLANDEDEGVQLVAATHSTFFDPEFGRMILSGLEKRQTANGLSAAWTIRELDGGKLNLDW